MIKHKKIWYISIIIILLINSYIWLLLPIKNKSNESLISIYDKIPEASHPFFYDSVLYPIWNYTTGGDINSVDMSSDGNYTIVSSIDKTFYFFNASNQGNKLEWTYSDPTGTSYNTAAISSDGNYIVAEMSQTVYLFNKSSNIPMWSYNITENIVGVDISSDGTYIVAITMKGVWPNINGSLYFFNNSLSAIKTPMWNYSFFGHAPISIAVSADGNYSVVGCLDFVSFMNNEVYLFNKTSSPLKTPMWTYETFVNDVSINDNGSYIVLGSGDQNVYVFEDLSSTPKWAIPANSSVWSIDISSDGRFIVAGCENRTVHILNNFFSYSTWYSDCEEVSNVGISDNGYEVTNGDDNHIHFYKSIDTKHVPSQLLWYYEVDNTVNDVAISSNGNYSVMGSSDNNVYFFNNLLPLPEMFSTGHGDLDLFNGLPDHDGTFDIFWTESVGAVNYSVYYHTSPITEINDSVKLNVEGVQDFYSFSDPYEISGFPTGTHYISAVAYNQNGYTIANHIVVKVILPPGPFYIYTNADTPDPDGGFIIYWNSSSDADNYSLYESPNFISEIDDDDTLIESGLEGNNIARLGYSKGTYYFVILAINTYTNYTSNCIKITVGEPPLTIWDIFQRYGLVIGIIIGALILGIALVVRKKTSKGIRVFISHAVDDFDKFRIEQLAKYLASQKEISHVYYCEEDLIGDIDDWMMKTVPKCQLLIFFSSDKSLNSIDCINELRLALKHNVQIAPILGEDMDWRDLEVKWDDLKLDISRQLGKEFDSKEFEKFSEDIYKYVLKVKQDLEREIKEKKYSKKERKI